MNRASIRRVDRGMHVVWRLIIKCPFHYTVVKLISLPVGNDTGLVLHF